jgi:hypothetical protein
LRLAGFSEVWKTLRNRFPLASPLESRSTPVFLLERPPQLWCNKITLWRFGDMAGLRLARKAKSPTA